MGGLKNDEFWLIYTIPLFKNQLPRCQIHSVATHSRVHTRTHTQAQIHTHTYIYTRARHYVMCGEKNRYRLIGLARTN